MLQSVIFDKNYFDVSSSNKWMRANNIPIYKSHESGKTIRYRQVIPPKNGFTYSTIRSKTKGVKFIMIYPTQ